MRQKFQLLAILTLLAAVLVACGSTAQPTAIPAAAPTSSEPDTDGDGIPDSAEALISADPHNADTDGDGIGDLEDTEPSHGANPITETSTTPGFTIDRILVEDNPNPNGAGDAPDHLELLLTNTSGADLSDFVIYYTITDETTGVVQSYYRTIPDFILAVAETTTLHFDNSGEAGHYSVNPNSLYYTSINQRIFEVTLHTAGFAPVTVSVIKDAGVEIAD
jgi:hypothetical protein